MESKFENREWLSEKIDRYSNVLNRINELLSIACILFLAFLGIGGFKSSNGWSILFLLAIPGLFFNIYAWRLIRYVCAAVSLMLSDTCTDKDEPDSQDE